MTTHQQELLNRVLDGKNPICLHILGQPLVNTLCDMIRELNTERENLEVNARKGSEG